MSQSNLGKAYVQIVPSAQGISGSISKVLNGEANSAGASTGLKIVKGIKTAFVAAGVGAFLKKSIQEGARYEQAVGGIETLFGASADRMKQYANEAYKTAGVSANEYMEQATSFAASLLQSVGGNQAKAAEAANQAVIDMSDNANKMGTNIQDIQNAYQGFAKQNYTMLDNLKLGYGGTKTEMERLLTDAEKITGVKYDINNLSDVYEAIHVIQGELGITGTTSKEAATTLTGSFASMKAAASNFMAQLVVGEDISGAMDALLDTALTFGQNLIKAFGNILLNLPDAIGHLSETLIAKVKESMNNPGIGNAAGEFIGKFVMGLITNLPKLLAAALTLVGYLVSTLGQAAGHLIVVGAQAIADWGRGLWQGFIASVQAVIEKIKTSISNKFDEIRNNISSKSAAAVAAVRNSFAQAREAITAPFETARAKVRSILDRIKGMFPMSIGRIFTNLSLPHISVSGGSAPFGIGGKGSLPRFHVSWNAMGGVYDSAQIVGIGVGEAGREIITPEELMRQIVNESNEESREILIKILEILLFIAKSDKSIKMDGRDFGRLVNEAVYG